MKTPNNWRVSGLGALLAIPLCVGCGGEGEAHAGKGEGLGGFISGLMGGGDDAEDELRAYVRLEPVLHGELMRTLEVSGTVQAGHAVDLVPDIPGKECLLTSNDMFYLPQLPRHAVIWGGGYIAVEFAGILAGLGVETTLLYRGDLFLRGFDGDVRRFTETEMRKKGVDLRFGVTINSVESRDDHYQVNLSNGDTLETGLVMAATGRRALVDGLGLTDLGVELTASGHVKVDAHFQTAVPSVYALGDVIGTPQLTPVALARAMVLSRRLFGDGQGDMDYSAIPTAVFCQPNIGTVGLTEEEAREAGHQVSVFRSEFRPMKYTLSGREERCLMKLVVDKETDKVLGAHMVGPDAGEITQGLAVAIKAGATKAQFDSTIGIHPTSAEEFVTMREPVA